MKDSSVKEEKEQSAISIKTSLKREASELNQGILLHKITNSGSDFGDIVLDVGRQFIIYLFPEGEIELTASASEEKYQLNSSQYGMMAFPVHDWQLSLKAGAGSEVRLLCLSISELHIIFGNFDFRDPETVKDALKNYRQQKFLTLKESTPGIRSIIHQLFSVNGGGVSKLVFQKGKIMEFLSVFLDSKDPDKSVETDCPYITDSLDWEKIRHAEKIIRDNLSNPPTIKELAKRVGTNEFKLKMGFKHLYKNTIYGYLNDYRMDFAKEMLGKKNILIKEVSEKVGYANTSHFIASFKKKFGITPKQYLRG